jgi:HAD superfamily hydrolase (TIGR01509 family)
MPSFPRALLLDLDGTVVDTHALLYRCYDHAVRAHGGRGSDRATWERCLGLPLEGVFAATFALYQQPLPEEALPALLESYRAMLRAGEADVRTFPGMREALEALRQRGVRLAVVTTKHRASATRHLESQRLTHLFDAVVTGDQCARCKPDPEPFLRALAALGVAAEEAAGVGDTEHDVRGARAAGALAVAACWGALNRPALLAARPDRVAEAPADLLGLGPGRDWPSHRAAGSA